MKVYEVTIKTCFITDDSMTSPAEWDDQAILSELSMSQHVEILALEMSANIQHEEVTV